MTAALRRLRRTAVGVDDAARTVVQGWRGPRTDALADVVGRLTSRKLLLPTAVGAWALGRSPAVSAAGRGVALALVVEMVAATAVKLATGRHRPEHSRTEHSRPEDGERARSRRPDGHSMPSGHTANVAATATALATATGSDTVLAAGMALAVASGLGRMVKDKHWASDVAVGLLLGYASAKVAAALDRR